MSSIAELRARLQASRPIQPALRDPLLYDYADVQPMIFEAQVGFVPDDDAEVPYPLDLMPGPNDYLIKRWSSRGYRFGKRVEWDDFLNVLLMDDDGYLIENLVGAKFYELDLVDEASNFLIRFPSKVSCDDFRDRIGDLSHVYLLGYDAWMVLQDDNERFAAGWTVEGEAVVFENTEDEMIFNILCHGVKTLHQ